MKTCTKCLVSKTFESFTKNKQFSDGYTYWCKSCYNDYHKSYKSKNYKKLKEYSKNYCKENSGKAVERATKWIEENRSQYQANQRVAQRCRRKRIKKVDDGTVTPSSIKEIWTGNCYICGDSILWDDPESHLDHVIPISAGGIHTISNVKWSCGTCNRKKSNKIINMYNCDKHGEVPAVTVDGEADCSVCVDIVTETPNVCIACEG